MLNWRTERYLITTSMSITTAEQDMRFAETSYVTTILCGTSVRGRLNRYFRTSRGVLARSPTWLPYRRESQHSLRLGSATHARFKSSTQMSQAARHRSSGCQLNLHQPTREHCDLFGLPASSSTKSARWMLTRGRPPMGCFCGLSIADVTHRFDGLTGARREACRKPC